MDPEPSSSLVAGKSRKWLGRFAFVLYSVVLLEITVRIVLAIGNIELDSSYGYPEDLFVRDPDRGYAYRPGFSGHFPNAAYRDITIEINAHGFRDDPFPAKGDRRRIVVLGDSITFGAGIESTARYTEFLDRNFCAEDRCEVLNLGVNGYQAGNYLAVARQFFDELRPDVVVVGLCMNDVQKPATWKSIAATTREGLVARIRGVASNLALLRVVVKLARSLTFDEDDYKMRWIRRAMAAWADDEMVTAFKANVSEIERVSKAAGAEGVFVLLFPERNQLEDFERYGDPLRVARAALGELNISLGDGRAALDLPDSPSAAELDRIFLSGDNLHFTPAANEALGGALGAELQRLGLIR